MIQKYSIGRGSFDFDFIDKEKFVGAQVIGDHRVSYD